MKNKTLAGAALSALLIAGSVQARSPDKAGLQGEACAAQFARDNAIKPEAGPFRIHRKEFELPAEGTVSSREQLIEVVTPQRYRMRGIGRIDYVDVVVNDAQSWLKQPQGWYKLPEDSPRLFVDSRYTELPDEVPVRCARELRQGQAVRSYRHQVKTKELTVRIKFQVDADTGLPVFYRQDMVLSGHGGTARGSMVTEARYEFDRSIRIDKPDGV